MRRGAGSTALAVLAAVVGVSGCGGGARQDASEPSGKFPVQVSASFPATQRLSQHTHLVISVTNAGHRTIPDLAVTICNVTCRYPAPVGEGTSVGAFSRYMNQQGLANHSRPVWVVDQTPGKCLYSCLQGGAGTGASTAPNTWQLSRPLQPGRTATFNWSVTAVQFGRFVVAWEVAAGLTGKAKAVVASGSSACGRTPCGTFPVTIAKAPGQSYVNDSGQIVQTQ